MLRQCYRRPVDVDPFVKGRWSRHDAGAVLPVGSGKIAGFNSIDGFSESDMYAVGWGGEIWHYNGRRWKKLDSATNLKLERVICGKDGKVYGVGQAGVVLKGRDAAWEVLKNEETEESFWGATWFADRLWMATLNGVYFVNEDDVVEACPISLPQPITSGWLVCAGTNLWSIGSYHVLWTADGKRWAQHFFKGVGSK
jgi:hypothetical protein